MDGQTIFERLAAGGTDAVYEWTPAVAKDGPREASFKVRPAALLDVMRTLRDDPDLAFDFLQNLTVVDWLKQGQLGCVYHLFSYAHRHEIVVKVDLPRDNPRVASVTSLWKSADWMEREQFDLLGVVFEGHRDLRRLMMPDDWVGFPMRKDYREPMEYRGMPTSRPSPLDLLVAHDKAHARGGPGKNEP